jgi:hypothetical protein
MPAAWPPEREVSFLLIQADAASRRGLIQSVSELKGDQWHGRISFII